MKARVDKLTAEQRRVIDRIVAIECLNATNSFELMDDICFVYSAVEEYNIGKKRARRLYEKYWSLRRSVQEFVRADGESVTIEDGLRESLMETRLLRKGIDVRAWKNELGERRIQTHITKR